MRCFEQEDFLKDRHESSITHKTHQPPDLSWLVRKCVILRSMGTELKQELKSITDQIVGFYKPKKIILFGSLAWGKPNKASDIDLLVVKDEVPQSKRDRIRELLSKVSYKKATDFLVFRPSEIRERLSMGDPFIKKVIKKGKVLYDG